MSFWITTKNSPSFYTQIFQWLTNMIVMLLWIQKYFTLVPGLEIELKHVFIEQLFFFQVTILLRSFVIAVRYGYASDFRVKMLSKKSQNFEYISSDLLIPSWINFTPEGLQIEIEAVLWRNQIDDAKFYLSFVGNINEDLSLKLSDKEFYKKNSFKMCSLQMTLKNMQKSIR